MGLTITQKILASHSGQDTVEPGDFIEANVDLALGHDLTAPLAIKAFKGVGAKQVFDPKRIALVLDHFAPNKDSQAAQQCKVVRDFAHEQVIANFFDGGDMGIEHALLPEQGLVLPGELVIGADSHTCTYGALGAFSTGVGSTDLAAIMVTGKIWLKVPESIKLVYHGQLKKWVSGKDLILYTIGQMSVEGALYMALEFTGEAIKSLSMDGRFTMCNMAIEAGAKNGIIEPDKTTASYINKRADRSYQTIKSDKDASYHQVIEYDVSKLEPQVALPHSPGNVKPVSEVEPIAIDQVVIGSCTNGRLGDMQIAAQILKGKKVVSKTRLLIFPATPTIYLQALQQGLIEIFIKAGATISPPTCGPCLGGHMGVLAKGEKAVSTTNRNFVGRMGHSQSEIYLTNPAVAATSAILGRIGSPEEL